jgi:hypothetical protein
MGRVRLTNLAHRATVPATPLRSHPICYSTKSIEELRHRPAEVTQVGRSPQAEREYQPHTRVRRHVPLRYWRVKTGQMPSRDPERGGWWRC